MTCLFCVGTPGSIQMLIAFYKPFNVLSQFTPELPEQRTLSEFGLPSGFYGIGRLDRDSEGLLLLSDEARWTDRLLNPKRAHPRTYWVQVEGCPDPSALNSLKTGVVLKDGKTRPAAARLLDEPLYPDEILPLRSPPIRKRVSIPDCWIELVLTEGRNRQVRRMTAAVGHPTLRLVRVAIGRLKLLDLCLQPGKWIALTEEQQQLL